LSDTAVCQRLDAVKQITLVAGDQGIGPHQIPSKDNTRLLKIEHFAKVSMDITEKLHKIGSILYADAFKTTLKQNCFLIFAFFQYP
jgi:exonuclease III